MPVGVTCRLCDRTDCEQRAFPPLREPLVIDENVRGVSIYAPTQRRQDARDARPLKKLPVKSSKR